MDGGVGVPDTKVAHDRLDRHVSSVYVAPALHFTHLRSILASNACC